MNIANRVRLKISSPKIGRKILFFQVREFRDLAYWALMGNIEAALSSLDSLIVSNVYVSDIILDYLWQDVDEFLSDSVGAPERLLQAASQCKNWSLSRTIRRSHVTIQALPLTYRLLDLTDKEP